MLHVKFFVVVFSWHDPAQAYRITYTAGLCDRYLGHAPHDYRRLELTLRLAPKISSSSSAITNTAQDARTTTSHPAPSPRQHQPPNEYDALFCTSTAMVCGTDRLSPLRGPRPSTSHPTSGPSRTPSRIASANHLHRLSTAATTEEAKEVQKAEQNVHATADAIRRGQAPAAVFQGPPVGTGEAEDIGGG